jgi:hypothetical protein
MQFTIEIPGQCRRRRTFFEKFLRSLHKSRSSVVQLVADFLGKRIGNILANDGLLVLEDHLLVAGGAYGQPSQRETGQQNGGEKDPGGAAHQKLTVVRPAVLIMT